MRKIPEILLLLEFLRNFKGNYYLVVHDQADPDAIGSAVAFQFFILSINPYASVFLVETKTSQLGLLLLDKINFQFNIVSKENIETEGAIIFLDTSQVDEYTKKHGNHILVFDHHIPLNSYDNIHFDFRLPEFYSTAEIITSLFYFSNINPTTQVKIALLVGLLFDTRRFFFADKETFECLAYLIKDDPSIYRKSLSYLFNNRGISERIACIKAAQRMKLVKINEYILLFSNVSAFEASAARALINLGGDLAIVISKSSSETRISCRSTPEFNSKTDISLGKDIIPHIIGKFGGTGGGHDGAAGYNASKPLEVLEIKNFLIDLISSMISKIAQE
ncbi:MAG: DHH family phosphoesterase [Candidatus Hodarchaeales archaeon]